MSREAFDPRAVAEGAMDRCCEGDPWPTARNLFRMQLALASLAIRRCASRVRSQPRSVGRWQRDPKHGGRPAVAIPHPRHVEDPDHYDEQGRYMWWGH